MALPSGDQSGSTSSEGCVVTCSGVPPAAGTSQMSRLPLRSETKATVLPSGDHSGWESWAGLVVSRVGSPPVRATTNTSASPSMVAS